MRHRSIIAAVVLVLLVALSVACRAAEPTIRVNELDSASSEDERRFVSTLDDPHRTLVQRTLSDARTYWASDPTYGEVRRLLQGREPLLGLVRVEIGRDHGAGYSSLWFALLETGPIELATDATARRLDTRAMTMEEWRALIAALEPLSRRAQPSAVSELVSDARVFSFCSITPESRLVFTVQLEEASTDQLALLREVFRIARLKTIPRDLEHYELFIDESVGSKGTGRRE